MHGALGEIHRGAWHRGGGVTISDIPHRLLGPVSKKDQKTLVPTSLCRPATGMRFGGEGGEATPTA
jgi:hypothetical protein